MAEKYTPAQLALLERLGAADANVSVAMEDRALAQFVRDKMPGSAGASARRNGGLSTRIKKQANEGRDWFAD